MSAYEEHADRLAEHVPEECDDQFCQICIEAEPMDRAVGIPSALKRALEAKPKKKRRRKIG